METNWESNLVVACACALRAYGAADVHCMILSVGSFSRRAP
jgi:hypothetical protein